MTYPGAAALTKAPLARAALPLPLATCAATAEAAAAAARALLVWTQTHSTRFTSSQVKTPWNRSRRCTDMYFYFSVYSSCIWREYSLIVHCLKVNAVLLVGMGWVNVFYLRQYFLLLVCGCVGTGEQLFQSRQSGASFCYLFIGACPTKLLPIHLHLRHKEITILVRIRPAQ